MLSSCPYFHFPTHLACCFSTCQALGGDPVEPAQPSTPLSGSPSHLICCSRSESWEAALTLFVVQHNGVQYTRSNTERRKSPLKRALVGWGYHGRLPAAAFVVAAFNQIKLCQSNLNRFSSVPPSPSIRRRMPFADMFVLPPSANCGWGWGYVSLGRQVTEEESESSDVLAWAVRCRGEILAAFELWESCPSF